MRDWWLRRLVAAHLCSAVSEWALTVGLLVYAFDWGGAPAVGALSVVLLLSPLLSTPLAGLAMARWRPHVVRLTGFAVQVVAGVVAAIAVALDAPAPAVAAGVVVALGGIASIPPTSAALMPVIARSANDLIAANLWVTHCDSASSLAGSMLAAAVLATAGPAALFAGCAAVAALAFVVTAWRPAAMAVSARSAVAGARGHTIRQALAELRARPWSRGVLLVASARNLVVGAFDVLLVVIALGTLGMGAGGPGMLSALVGGGAFCSTFVVTAAVRRARLRAALMAAVVVTAALVVVLGARTQTAVAIVVLPLVGVAIASMDAMSRTMLQRSSDPRHLGALFASLGFVAAVGQLSGSLVAQVALAVGGARIALVAVGVLLVALAAVSVRSLRSADAHTEVPVTEMSLLSGVPTLAGLTTVDLEQIARLAVHEHVLGGTQVMVEGEPGRDCVVVVDGTFEVTVHGNHLRLAGRGDVLGELALLTNVGRISTVTALTDGEVLRIGRDPFLVALTGFDVAGSVEVPDSAVTLERYRTLVAEQARRLGTTSPHLAETWIGLGAAGRLLGDPSYLEPLQHGIGLAAAASNDLLLAHAVAMTTWPGTFFRVADNPDLELIALCEQAVERVGPHDPVRVRLLATLASHATFAYDAGRRAALIAEAATLATAAGDPALRAVVLNAEFICLWEPATLERRRQIGAELTDIALRTGDAETEFLGRFFTAYCTAEGGDLAAARAQLIGLRRLLDRVRIEYFDFLAERLVLAIDIARGEPGVRLRIDSLANRHRSSHADTDGTWAIQVGALAYQDGTLASMRPIIQTMIGGPHARTWQAARALAELADGDHHAATRTVIAQGDVPRSYFWMTVLQVQAEVASELGLVDRCEELLGQLAPYRGQIGITASGSLCFGLVTRSLGSLALALGRWDEAAELLADAAVEAERNGMRHEATIVRRLQARLHRPAPIEPA